MNSIIKDQLSRCKVADIPYFEDTTIMIEIPKGTSMVVTPYQVNNCYLIELADYILNPPDDFTLADNWNKGSIPNHKYYKCQVSQVMGKMIKINGCGYDFSTQTDTSDVWEGWVPQQGVRIIQELN